MDSIPIVAFTGQVPTHLIGNDAFQEADNVGITRSATKHNFLVKDGKDLAPIIKEAFHIASTGRPGPVHVDLPKDILVKEWTFEYPRARAPALVQPDVRGPSRADQEGGAARSCGPSGRCSTWAAARSPSDASPELRELAELTQIPRDADPHGPRRVPDGRIRCRSTCSACTAPTTPTWPCTTRTAWSRSARASTTG